MSDNVVYSPSYWQHYFRKEFIPAIEHLVSSLETRLLPNFQETDISHEAEVVADEAWEHFMSLPGTGNEDPSDFVDAAQDAGISHYMMLTGIRQGIINMFAAGLYHAFEQQLLLFHRKELLPLGHENEQSLLKLSSVKEALKARTIDIESFNSWRLIDELRLVANTVKHAAGDSVEKLRVRRPDLFEDPRLAKYGFSKLASSPAPKIYLPMVGEDLFVTTQDLSNYKGAIVMFWGQLSDAIAEM